MIAALRCIARQARTIRRQQDELARLSRGYRRANDRCDEAMEATRIANDTTDRAIAAAKGWRSRAEALYALADRDKRDGVMECLSWIEGLDEVEK